MVFFFFLSFFFFIPSGVVSLNNNEIKVQAFSQSLLCIQRPATPCNCEHYKGKFVKHLYNFSRHHKSFVGHMGWSVEMGGNICYNGAKFNQQIMFKRLYGVEKVWMNFFFRFILFFHPFISMDYERQHSTLI